MLEVKTQNELRWRAAFLLNRDLNQSSLLTNPHFLHNTTWLPEMSQSWMKELPLCSDVVQSLRCVQFSVTPWTAACQAPLSSTSSQSLLKFMSIESAILYNYLILCCPLLFLSSVFPSIRVFSNESALHIRRPKDWSFSLSISPSNEYLGLISFRVDWSPCSPSTFISTALSQYKSHQSPDHNSNIAPN